MIVPLRPSLVTSYADGFKASAVLSAHAAEVADWASSKGLTISIPKSNATLFTPHTHQATLDPQVSMNDTSLSLVRYPKILGVNYDTMFTFAPHVRAIAARAGSRLNLLRALAGTTWGQDKETLLLTYKMMASSILHYAAPIWFPNVKDSPLSRLESVQNAALRLAPTGCPVLPIFTLRLPSCLSGTASPCGAASSLPAPSDLLILLTMWSLLLLVHAR